MEESHVDATSPCIGEPLPVPSCEGVAGVGPQTFHLSVSGVVPASAGAKTTLNLILSASCAWVRRAFKHQLLAHPIDSRSDWHDLYLVDLKQDNENHASNQIGTGMLRFG